MCESSSDTDDDRMNYDMTPPDILETAAKMSDNLLPEKSRKLYQKCYQDFMDWQVSKNTTSFSENVYITNCTIQNDGDFTVVKTDGVKKYLCNLCGVEVSSRYSIKQHVATRHRELKCPLCEKLFSKSREQKLHVRLEHGMEMTGKNLRQSAKHTCHICNKDFPVKSSLHRHNHYKHKLKQCPDCTGMFTVKQLPKHRCEVHGVELPTCGVCGYKNPNEHLVVQHQRKVHLKEKNVSCPHCELKFYDVHYLNRHIVSHGTEVLYECSYCYKKFPRKTTMRMHEKIHKGEKNKVCAVCGDRFVQKASLNYHMTKHHPEAC